MSKQYDVGYGKPPTKHQFKKGKSGNPSGRPKLPWPKPPLDPQKIPIAELKSLITIIENGKKKKITVAEAIWKSVFAAALKGDKTCIKYAVDFMLKRDKYAFEDDGTTFFRITKEHRQAMEAFLEAADKYAPLLEADSDQKQGNGSSSSS